MPGDDNHIANTIPTLHL